MRNLTEFTFVYENVIKERNFCLKIVNVDLDIHRGNFYFDTFIFLFYKILRIKFLHGHKGTEHFPETLTSLSYIKELSLCLLF